MMCSYEMAGWLGSGIPISGLEILPYKRFSPVTDPKIGLQEKKFKIKRQCVVILKKRLKRCGI